MEEDSWEALFELESQFEDYTAVDPLVNGRRMPSLVELQVSGFVFQCPQFMKQDLVDEAGSMVRRIPLEDYSDRSAGNAYSDLVTTPEGKSFTRIDLSFKDWGIYTINPATGHIRHIVNGEEKRLGPLRRHLLRDRLNRLTF